MIKIKTRKKAVLTIAAIAIAAAIIIPMFVYPTFAVTEQKTQRNLVYVKARGMAIQKINNETVKTPANLTLILMLGEKRGEFRPVLNVKGSININGTVYTVECGDGAIQTQRHIAFIRCLGNDTDGNQIAFRLGIAYFWWGGKLYVFRGKASLHTTDTRMLLMLRGLAKTA
ncbi:hypothetical protein J7L49_02290 [Candidatus Bathyarchaeota archaeon]|nr:hypothetical protein [Candidatus Bathyarchaeota archaeon]